MKVFLVEDSPSIRRLLVRRLDRMQGLRLVGEATGEAQAQALIRWTQPDIVLMDLSLASGSGLHLLPELRRAGFKGHIAVLTSQDTEAYRRACIDAGADAFYDKGSGLETLFDDLAAFPPKVYDTPVDEHPTWLLRDGLTGLYSEAALVERLDQSAKAAARDGVNLAVYVLRLHGHVTLPGEAADALAKAIAVRLGDSCTDSDIVARRSVQQFCVVLTRLDGADEAADYARQLRELMAEPFTHDGQDYRFGFELGMALFPTDAVSSRGLLTLAEASAFGAL